MKSAQLVYSILCDDVRLEVGNKLSFMGIFENVYLSSFPAVILRFAAVNHWIGAGDYQTQVRVVSPEGREVALSGQSTFRSTLKAMPTTSRSSPTWVWIPRAGIPSRPLLMESWFRKGRFLSV
jgi:hypothetical protein